MRKCKFVLIAVALLAIATAAWADLPPDVDYSYTKSFGHEWVMQLDPGVPFPWGEPLYSIPGNYILIPNMYRPLVKHLWFEIDFLGDVPTGVSPDSFQIETPTMTEKISAPDLTVNGKSFTWHWTIIPQPCWEKIVFRGSPFDYQTFVWDVPGARFEVGQIGVATKCVPEPSGVLALASGLIGLGFVVRRRLA